MNQPIRLGISTCPNDTFTFHALINQEVDWRGLDFRIELLDIQQLNTKLLADEFDVAKASFHAALKLSDRWKVLPSGSALGFGVGPLLLSAVPGTQPTDASQITLCPGPLTTATLLFELFYPDTARVEHRTFSDIMPQLQSREADFGVCIHEGRFTWQDQGLGLVEDLGTRWETETDCPLPLGGILVSRRLPDDVISTVQQVVHESLQFARADPDAAIPTMRRYAQEFNDDVLMQHVDLYVNDWTMELGQTGHRALQELCRRAQSIGLIADGTPPLEIA